LLVHHIVPDQGLVWLTSDQELLSAWLATISGDMEIAGPLGETIQQADRSFVAQNLSAGDAVRAAPGPTKVLWERLLAGLRHLILEGELPLSRNGAAGWLVRDDLWLVSKRTIDALRVHLWAEGHTGIPSKNERICDTLQEHGVLEPCGYRAIWRAAVAGSGWSHDLTVTRIYAAGCIARCWAKVSRVASVRAYQPESGGQFSARAYRNVTLQLIQDRLAPRDDLDIAEVTHGLLSGLVPGAVRARSALRPVVIGDVVARPRVWCRRAESNCGPADYESDVRRIK